MGGVVPRRPAYCQCVTSQRCLTCTTVVLIALAAGGAAAAARPVSLGSADKQPPGKQSPATQAPPGKRSGHGEHAPKPHQSITVGIAYSNGALILSSARAGQARIVMRSADGRHKFLKLVTLQTPTTTLPLKQLFPKITTGRYQVVVSPRFRDGFLSGAWITVT